MCFALMLALLTSTSTFPLSAQTVGSKHFRTQRLGEGIYVVLPLAGTRTVCNAGIIDTGTETLLIDPFVSEEAAADLHTAAQRLTTSPIRYVITTHGHHQHGSGNGISLPGARLIGTPAALASMAARSASPLPTMALDGRLTLRGPLRTVELIATGRGHGTSDLVVFLPAERFLFTGDIVVIGMHPSVTDGEFTQWLASLRRLEALGPDVVIPGRGPVGEGDDLRVMACYLQDIDAMTRAAAAAGKSLHDLATIGVPTTYAEWEHSSLFLENLRSWLTRLQSRPR